MRHVPSETLFRTGDFFEQKEELKCGVNVFSPFFAQKSIARTKNGAGHFKARRFAAFCKVSLFFFFYPSLLPYFLTYLLTCFLTFLLSRFLPAFFFRNLKIFSEKRNVKLTYSIFKVKACFKVFCVVLNMCV